MAPPPLKRRGGAPGKVSERRLQQVFLVGEPRVELRVFAGAEELATAAAEEFAARAHDALSRRGRFTAVLPGGSGPIRFFEILAGRKSGIRWSRVHVFWGDERFVPPAHPESNFRTAQETLLAHVPIPQANVHRIRTESLSPDAAAAIYEQEIRTFFRLPAGRFPRFDLVVLGLGADGHTASLFPGSEAVTEDVRMVVAALIARLGTHRITLTLPVFNSARAVMFLVSGKQKAEALARALEGGEGSEGLPAPLVRPRRGPLLWMVDRAASGLLRR